MKHSLFSVLTLVVLSSCSNNSSSSDSDVFIAVDKTPIINYSMINSYPHDTTLFTEGFVFHDGNLFESSGSPNDIPQTKSVIGAIDIKTGKFNQKIEIDKNHFFGEGIVFFKSKLYQLTYKNQQGFIYDDKSFKQIGQFKYSNIEGWSLTTDGTSLIMSDGTNKLTYLDPKSLKQTKTLLISENGIQRDSLNELEFIKGFIYANIWMNNFIVKIDPLTGKVVGKIDLSSLTTEAKSSYPKSDVLNGIAYDSLTDKIYVTGKMWPKIYQIEFNH